MIDSPLLFIVGPTSTGKTTLALQLAEAYLAEAVLSKIVLISADSRQVYQGLETVTGADVPAGWTRTQASGLDLPFFHSKSGKIELHGVSCVPPTQEWSLGVFHSFAHSIIERAWQEAAFPIVVGGTGLYVTKLLSTDSDLSIPPNSELRKQLEPLTVTQLQAKLEQLDHTVLSALNDSDRHNPRRLIRWIEKLSTDADELVETNKSSVPNQAHSAWIGLELPLTQLESKIATRVQARWHGPAKEEVLALTQAHPNQDLPAFSATGVAEISQHMAGELTEPELIATWTRTERHYAKRQRTWWRQYGQTIPGLKWYPADSDQLLSSVKHQVDAILRV